jgi:selenocysteine-specific elongation factor
LDADLIERGIAAAPRSVKTSDLAIVMVKRIPYFTAGDIKSKGKYHVSLGHQTVIGEATFFSCPSTDDHMFNKSSLKAVNSQI